MMENNIGNYAQHAQYWDWGNLDHDRTTDDEKSYNFAKQYGNSILIPMCAWGHLGAYMAERGMNVTAFDITPEMIEEGKKRFGDIKNLNLFVGDATDFRFDIEPVDVCAFVEMGWIHSMDEVKKALVCINNHLRDGGYLILEEGINAYDDEMTSPKTFRVENNPYTDRTVYKVTNVSRNEAATRRWYCSQTVYTEYNDGRKEQFDHNFYLQGYSRGEWLAALRECGFEVNAEYKNREKEPWSEGDGHWIVEAVKRGPIPSEQLNFAVELVSCIDSGEGGIFRDSAAARSYVDCIIYERGVFHSCEIFDGLRIHVALSEDTGEYNNDIAMRIRKSLMKTERDSCQIWLRNENKRTIEFLIKEFSAIPDGKHFYASIEFVMRREQFEKVAIQSVLEVRPYEEDRIDDYLRLLDGSMTYIDPPPNFMGRKEHYLKHFAEHNQKDSFEAFWKDDMLVGLYWRKNAEIDFLAVDVNQQRKGYGTIMLTRAINMVFEKTDAEFAYLYAVDWNIKGQSFYRKYGMTENGHSFGIKINNFKGERK
jgi:SAM-dependent methyltransferase/GNAT superfamily N-acetyltransferase